MMALEIVMTQMKTTGKKVSIIRNRKRQSEEVFQQLRYKLCLLYTSTWGSRNWCER